MLLEHVKSNGQGAEGWRKTTELFPTRTMKQCRDRYITHLTQNVDRGPWGPQEEKILFQLQAHIGNSWTDIAKYLPGRSEASVKNRFYSALRRIERAHGITSDISTALVQEYALKSMTEEDAIAITQIAVKIVESRSNDFGSKGQHAVLIAQFKKTLQEMDATLRNKSIPSISPSTESRNSSNETVHSDTLHTAHPLKHEGSGESQLSVASYSSSGQGGAHAAPLNNKSLTSALQTDTKSNKASDDTLDNSRPISYIELFSKTNPQLLEAIEESLPSLLRVQGMGRTTPIFHIPAPSRRRPGRPPMNRRSPSIQAATQMLAATASTQLKALEASLSMGRVDEKTTVDTNENNTLHSLPLFVPRTDRDTTDVRDKDTATAVRNPRTLQRKTKTGALNALKVLSAMESVVDQSPEQTPTSASTPLSTQTPETTPVRTQTRHRTYSNTMDFSSNAISAVHPSQHMQHPPELPAAPPCPLSTPGTLDQSEKVQSPLSTMATPSRPPTTHGTPNMLPAVPCSPAAKSNLAKEMKSLFNMQRNDMATIRTVQHPELHRIRLSTPHNSTDRDIKQPSLAQVNNNSLGDGASTPVRPVVSGMTEAWEVDKRRCVSGGTTAVRNGNFVHLVSRQEVSPPPPVPSLRSRHIEGYPVPTDSASVWKREINQHPETLHLGANASASSGSGPNACGSDAPRAYQDNAFPSKPCFCSKAQNHVPSATGVPRADANPHLYASHSAQAQETYTLPAKRALASVVTQISSGIKTHTSSDTMFLNKSESTEPPSSTNFTGLSSAMPSKSLHMPMAKPSIESARHISMSKSPLDPLYCPASDGSLNSVWQFLKMTSSTTTAQNVPVPVKIAASAIKLMLTQDTNLLACRGSGTQNGRHAKRSLSNMTNTSTSPSSPSSPLSSLLSSRTAAPVDLAGTAIDIAYDATGSSSARNSVAPRSFNSQTATATAVTSKDSLANNSNTGAADVTSELFSPSPRPFVPEYGASRDGSVYDRIPTSARRFQVLSESGRKLKGSRPVSPLAPMASRESLLPTLTPRGRAHTHGAPGTVPRAFSTSGRESPLVSEYRDVYGQFDLPSGRSVFSPDRCRNWD